MKQFKRAIALLLVLVLVLSIFPSAVAAGTEDVPQGNATWISEGIGAQIKYDDVNEVFYVDLTNLLNSYSVYEITATNEEDVTYTGSSVAEITISKLADVTTVKIVSRSGAVKATWEDSANTAGVSDYRVELLKLNDAGSYDAWKTYTAAAGETSYTFADEDIDQSAVDTYKVRVTALGTKDYEADVFYLREVHPGQQLRPDPGRLHHGTGHHSRPGRHRL